MQTTGVDVHIDADLLVLVVGAINSGSINTALADVMVELLRVGEHGAPEVEQVGVERLVEAVHGPQRVLLHLRQLVPHLGLLLRVAAECVQESAQLPLGTAQ